MIALVLIAIVAGCASALMFISLASGSLIAVLLLYLAPLPLMVVAIGWGPLCATIGGISAAIGLGVLFGVSTSITFAIAIALPAWWFGHLILLGRPVTAGLPGHQNSPTPPALEWYPIGRILLWIAGFAALTTIAVLLSLGSNAADIADTLRRAGLAMIGPQNEAPSGDVDRLIDAMVLMVPAASALVSMLWLTSNLWLAAKITAASGRLHRPWPDLKSAVLPQMTLVALSVAIALCFIGGLPSMFAQSVAAALVMGYALIGFAVLHTITLALKNRAVWLSFTYVIVAAFSWLMLGMAALGVADAVFGLRQRYLRGRPPPLPAA